jgi:DNA-binding protein YbaB
MDPTQGYDDQAPSTRSNYIASAGEGADGLVRIELDGDGRLWDVVLDPQITELPADELRTALFDAITAAQDGLPTRTADTFEDTAAEINTVAERRFAEISEALHDLSRRAARR